MARTYRATLLGRVRDRLVLFTLRRGFGPPGICLLTVVGRKSGKAYSTPVAPVEDGGGRWLVAGYGVVGWVRNARAAGRVTLRRGRTTETLVVTELEPAEAAPILKRYLGEHPRSVGAYFDTSKDAPVAEFEGEAARHPVFKLETA